MFTIVSTRYNDTTWQENITYRKKTNHNGCIYGAPHMLSNKIVVDSLVFVVEMNNSLNKIEGIGLMRNNIRLDKYTSVYKDGNFNRYVLHSVIFNDDRFIGKSNFCEFTILNDCVYFADKFFGIFN